MNTELDYNVYIGGRVLYTSPDGYMTVTLYNDDYYAVYSDTNKDNISAMCITDIIDEEVIARLYESRKD